MKKNPFQTFRQFLVRTRKYNTTATRSATQMSYDDDDNGTRLSGAFIIVLLLHIIAVVGVFAFARIKESRRLSTPPEPSTQTAASKTTGSKTTPPKQPVASAASAQAASKIAVPPTDPDKTSHLVAPSTHMVKEGETLTKIAMAYAVTVPEMIAANKLKNQDDIRVGQPLAIPELKPAGKAPVIPDGKPPVVAVEKNTPGTSKKAPTPTKKTTRTYTVKKNDTAVKIARENGCSYEELVKLNNIKDPKKIQTGQVLKLPGKNG
jgi:LysM repeat protein